MNLNVQNLGFAHGSTATLEGINATFEAGKFSVILGPNGAGKSTLLACLAGLRKPNSGTAKLGDESISNMPPTKRAKRIGLLPKVQKRIGRSRPRRWLRSAAYRTRAAEGHRPMTTGPLPPRCTQPQPTALRTALSPNYPVANARQQYARAFATG